MAARSRASTTPSPLTSGVRAASSPERTDSRWHLVVLPLKPKLSSATRTREREPSGRVGPQVMPSTLSASAPVVVKSNRSFFVIGVSVPDRASSPLTSVAPSVLVQ